MLQAAEGSLESCLFLSSDFCPISLIAPLGGVSLIFNALLTRFGLVCGIKETMSYAEWRATVVVLVGVTLVATAGPGSEETADIDQERFLRDLPAKLEKPAFLACAAVATTTVGGWVCLLHLKVLRKWRPAYSSLAASTMSGLTASMCGTFSVVFLKIASNWIPMAFRKVFAEDRDQIADPWGYWLAYLALFGLATVRKPHRKPPRAYIIPRVASHPDILVDRREALRRSTTSHAGGALPALSAQPLARRWPGHVCCAPLHLLAHALHVLLRRRRL